jgi:hypothetical protein
MVRDRANSRRFDATDCLTSILSRLHLAQLVDLRNGKRRHYEDQVPVQRTRKTNTKEGYGRAELMAEWYPRLTPEDDQYETMYTSLKNDPR